MSTPLVFLHPLGADRGFWTVVTAELGGRDHVALDLPGHGSAAALPRGADVAAFADAVTGQLDPGTRVHLVGMSLGGIVAQQIALDRPDLVASVVLVDTVPVYPEPMRQMWRDRAAVARRGELATLVEPMVEMWFTPELSAAGDARVSHAREVFARTDPEGYARSCDLLAEVDLSERLAALRVPAVVVCGRDDAQPFRDAAVSMARATGAGAVHWLPGKHACAVESPRLFAELLDDRLVTPGR
ncbi:alpha/beta fold hydrolase [Mycolicibacterium smegmatis]|uniref:alpha/beta fold hydrolase n=1 Tax=Mycolicibacterium smegmatis TaxID=1772 RepID=UPI001E4AC7FA|nr:alpha/beta fold hydrolase [Mycolicibacterium smegmatis]UGU33509.1 alpha/beta fold hydrolase [Mycolicibacterium smegmatis]ULN33308.1 alpha/beta fold hydrolase [Mycolicibacterium smegmatis]ULN68373.1 alpha/beta fold hydrolase [Mycolicibacterium smegmatis]